MTTATELKRRGIINEIVFPILPLGISYISEEEKLGSLILFNKVIDPYKINTTDIELMRDDIDDIDDTEDTSKKKKPKIFSIPSFPSFPLAALLLLGLLALLILDKNKDEDEIKDDIDDDLLDDGVSAGMDDYISNDIGKFYTKSKFKNTSLELFPANPISVALYKRYKVEAADKNVINILQTKGGGKPTNLAADTPGSDKYKFFYRDPKSGSGGTTLYNNDDFNWFVIKAKGKKGKIKSGGSLVSCVDSYYKRTLVIYRDFVKDIGVSAGNKGKVKTSEEKYLANMAKALHTLIRCLRVKITLTQPIPVMPPLTVSSMGAIGAVGEITPGTVIGSAVTEGLPPSVLVKLIPDIVNVDVGKTDDSQIIL